MDFKIWLECFWRGLCNIIFSIFFFRSRLFGQRLPRVEENVSAPVNCALLLQRLQRHLLNVAVVRVDEWIFEKRLAVPFMLALTLRATHLLTLVASEDDLLVLVQLAVGLLHVGVSVVAVLRVLLCTLGPLLEVLLHDLLDGLLGNIKQQTRLLVVHDR